MLQMPMHLASRWVWAARMDTLMLGPRYAPLQIAMFNGWLARTTWTNFNAMCLAAPHTLSHGSLLLLSPVSVLKHRVSRGKQLLQHRDDYAMTLRRHILATHVAAGYGDGCFTECGLYARQYCDGIRRHALRHGCSDGQLGLLSKYGYGLRPIPLCRFPLDERCSGGLSHSRW